MEATKSFAHEGDIENSRFNGNGQVVQLWSYQHGLRLRHLSQIVGRNLQGHGNQAEPVPANPLPSKNPRPPAKKGYYFTLHVPSTKEEFYSSELQCTCNPNWWEMHADNIKPINLRSLKGILIKLWFKPEDGKPEVTTCWGVYFSGLIPVGSVMPYTYENYEPNTLFFKIRTVFYTASAEGVRKPSSLYYGYNLPLSETKRSYTVNSLSRLHSTKRAQRQQEIRCQETHSVLEQHGITRNSRASHLATEVEDCRVKVALLREQLQMELDHLRALKLSADNLDNQNQEKGLQLLGGYQELYRQKKQVKKLQEAALNEYEKLRYSCDCLRDWRVQLISQLPLIYPLSQNSNGKFHVCGVRLPDAEQYENSSDVSLSVGLGYVAHILYILAQFLHVPLRYPIKPFGSQATITDTTSLQLRDMEREFPLYSRGKEKEKLHFNYGVFLLNKNIAQMRCYGGIGTQDLRPTLPNLHFFLTRLVQPSSNAIPPIAVMPDVLVSPLVYLDQIGYEVRTPAGLLPQKQSQLMSSDRVDHSTTPSQGIEVIDGHENNTWKTMKSSSDTDSPSEISPAKLSLFVREVTPLDDKDSSGKFVFVDQVTDEIGDPILSEKSLGDRFSHSNGFSFSLDNGLNHIGGKGTSYYKIKDLSSCDDLKLNKVSKMLKDLPRGSDPSLLTKSNLGLEEEEESVPLFKEQTMELLRSWTEDAPSHYLDITQVCSTERLEEVGVECHESFMCPSEESKTISEGCHKPTGNEITSACDLNINKESMVVSEVCDVKTTEKSEAVSSKGMMENEKRSVVPKDVSDVGETKTSDVVEKEKKESEKAPFSLADFGITEDMFLNDVAFRTDVLAKQNCSFKMSFSRQSTEDEYH